MDRRSFLDNPYRPGAGQFPPFLAGRTKERDNFKRVLRQRLPCDNILITGLRGFGKTVLLEHFRTLAAEHDWLWVGNDLSESSSLTEERLAIRILTDLAATLTHRATARGADHADGGSEFQVADERARTGKQVFDTLKVVYEQAPGLPSDRLKAVLVRACSLAAAARAGGIVLAYDEAQCLADHAERNEFPMSMLVETVASLQRQDAVVPVLLVLCGLPQVQDSLTNTRTYTERMFHVMPLERLSRDETWQAIATPFAKLSVPASAELLAKATEFARGYPYLIQFFGKELVEQLLENGGTMPLASFPSPATMDRLDAGLFAARWNKTTDKQREILVTLASRDGDADEDFSAQDVVALSPGSGISNAQASSHLHALCERGLIYRTRHGRFAFTVPMSDRMILRRLKMERAVVESWDGTGMVLSVATPKPRKSWRHLFR